MTSKLTLTTIVVFVALIALYFINNINKDHLYVDEGHYYRQIANVAKFNFTFDIMDHVFALPGYGISIGIIEYFWGPSMQSSRLVTTILSLLSVLIFYLLACKIDRENSEMKTLQYFFFPILFIFFFLLYTDVYSLLYVLISFLLVLKKRYYWAGFIGFLSLLVRQNNIVWLGFFASFIFVENIKLKRINVNVCKTYFKDIILFLFSFIAVLIFVFINKGATVADKPLAPLSFHLENLFFLLFLFFFLFLPLNIANFSKIIGLVNNKIQFILLFLIEINILLVYILTFKVSHPSNNIPDDNFFMRNIFLSYMTGGIINKIVSFFPIGYSILSLFVTPLIDKKYCLIYPFTFLFLGMLWLVEPRYYLIPFTFFLLFKKSQSFLVEYSTLAIYIFFAEIIFFLILSKKFFL